MAASKKKNKPGESIENLTRITPIEAWAARYGVLLHDALKIQRLMGKRSMQSVRECNGDPHARVQDRNDKDACSTEWGKDVEITIREIDVIMGKHGLEFDPGTGLWGSVKKDGEYIGDVPA